MTPSCPHPEHPVPSGLSFSGVEAPQSVTRIHSASSRARGVVRRHLGIDWLGDAVTKGVITESEAGLLREIEALTARVIAVDDFDPDEVKPNYMTPGHNTKAVQSAGAG
jgi:hypothetical protein